MHLSIIAQKAGLSLSWRRTSLSSLSVYLAAVSFETQLWLAAIVIAISLETR